MGDGSTHCVVCVSVYSLPQPLQQALNGLHAAVQYNLAIPVLFSSHSDMPAFHSRCYQVASVPWYQRKMASALLATPPTSSYEEVSSV